MSVHQPSTETVRATFARLAPYYDPLLAVAGVGGQSRVRRRMVAKLELSGAARVLDLGCGTGLGFATLETGTPPGRELTGIDLSREMLARAEHRARRERWTNISLVRADARLLPFADETFDAICSSLVVSGGSTWPATLYEPWRVLAPGGVVVIIDATPKRGAWKSVAPILHALYRRIVAWELPEPPVEHVVRELTDEVTVEAAFGGLYTIIAGRKVRA